jgi:hypothetical protein
MADEEEIVAAISMGQQRARSMEQIKYFSATLREKYI